MASQINIVLNAIDNYTSTLTGLDAGLNIVSRAFDGLKAAANFAFDAVGKGVELARIGGAFDEQRNQFENLAQSLEVSGQRIIDTVQEISSNTLTELGAVGIATKALAVGLRGPELETTLAFVKKWSEATGDSFESAAERITTAIGTGRYSVLKQMGLVIEKGASLQQVTDAISTALKRFGDTGFNTADKLDSLNVAQEDFVRKIGQGINQSKEFQSVLGAVADAVFKFVKGFDSAAITSFIDTLVKGTKFAGTAVLNQVPAIKDGINTLITDTKKSVASATTFIVDSAYGTAKEIAKAINYIIDAMQAVNMGNIISDIASSLGRLSSGAIFMVTKTMATITDLLVGGVQGVLDTLASAIREFPSVADALGVDAKEIQDLSSNLDNVKNNVDRALGGVGGFAEGFGDRIRNGLENFNETAEKYKISIEDIDKAQQNARKSAFDALGTDFDAKKGEIKIVVNDSELAKINKFKEALEAEINIKLDANKAPGKEEDGIDDNSVLVGLVRILTNALSNAAAGEGVPLSVSTR